MWGLKLVLSVIRSRMKNGWSLITITPWNYPMNKLYGQILTIPLLKTMASQRVSLGKMKSILLKPKIKVERWKFLKSLTPSGGNPFSNIW